MPSFPTKYPGWNSQLDTHRVQEEVWIMPVHTGVNDLPEIVYRVASLCRSKVCTVCIPNTNKYERCLQSKCLGQCIMKLSGLACSCCWSIRTDSRTLYSNHPHAYPGQNTKALPQTVWYTHNLTAAALHPMGLDHCHWCLHCHDAL